MKKLFVTLIAVGFFYLGGCTVLDSGPKPGPVTDAKVILGTWELIHGDGGYVQYNEDGTYLVSTLRENLPEQPAIVGEYWFQEGQYFQAFS